MNYDLSFENNKFSLLNIFMYCSLHVAFIYLFTYLTIYLGDFSKSIYKKDPHFYSTEIYCSAELMFYDLASPLLRGI